MQRPGPRRLEPRRRPGCRGRSIAAGSGENLNPAVPSAQCQSRRASVAAGIPVASGVGPGGPAAAWARLALLAIPGRMKDIGGVPFMGMAETLGVSESAQAGIPGQACDARAAAPFARRAWRIACASGIFRGFICWIGVRKFVVDREGGGVGQSRGHAPLLDEHAPRIATSRQIAKSSHPRKKWQHDENLDNLMHSHSSSVCAASVKRSPIFAALHDLLRCMNCLSNLMFKC